VAIRTAERTAKRYDEEYDEVADQKYIWMTGMALWERHVVGGL